MGPLSKAPRSVSFTENAIERLARRAVLARRVVLARRAVARVAAAAAKVVAPAKALGLALAAVAAKAVDGAEIAWVDVANKSTEFLLTSVPAGPGHDDGLMLGQ